VGATVGTKLVVLVYFQIPLLVVTAISRLPLLSLGGPVASAAAPAPTVLSAG
jgi:hypothetical protein